jgi:FolB domain-containing protein
MIVTATIKDIRCRTIIGAYDSERTLKQDVLINLAVSYDASKVIKSDNLEDTLDYYLLSEEIVEKVESTNFFILEKLADFVLEIILSRDIAIEASVEVDKIAPLRHIAESVSITASRSKE